MPQNSLSVGDPIKARCTKCRQNRDHFIVSMNEDRADKVKCTTCEHLHNYKPPVVRKTAAEYLISQNREMKRRKNENECKEWKALKLETDSKKAQTYSMTAAYKVKTLIKHPVFGLGQVQRIVGSQKIEVLFEDGIKTMRCK